MLLKIIAVVQAIASIQLLGVLHVCVTQTLNTLKYRRISYFQCEYRDYMVAHLRAED